METETREFTCPFRTCAKLMAYDRPVGHQHEIGETNKCWACKRKLVWMADKKTGELRWHRDVDAEEHKRPCHCGYPMYLERKTFSNESSAGPLIGGVSEEWVCTECREMGRRVGF